MKQPAKKKRSTKRQRELLLSSEARWSIDRCMRKLEHVSRHMSADKLVQAGKELRAVAAKIAKLGRVLQGDS